MDMKLRKSVYLLLLLLFGVLSCLANPISPYVHVRFYDGNQVLLDSDYSQGPVVSGAYDAGGRQGWAEATHYTLRAINDLSLDGRTADVFMTNPYFVDALTVYSPFSQATYQWAPIIHVGGFNDWDGGSTSGPVTFSIVQWVLRAGSNTWTVGNTLTRTPEKGRYDESMMLTPVQVPANEWFNYAIAFYLYDRAGSTWGNTWVGADYGSTLTITGLSLKDEAGNPVDVPITSAAGVSYTVNGGIQAAPEPGTILLTLTSFAFLAAARFARLRR